jgi:hypothetical protein
MNKIIIVSIPSAIDPLRLCFLGKGDSKAAAVADAGGRRCIARDATVKEWDVSHAVAVFGEENIYC